VQTKFEDHNNCSEDVSTTFSEFSNAEIMKKIKKSETNKHGKKIIPKYLKEVSQTFTSRNPELYIIERKLFDAIFWFDHRDLIYSLSDRSIIYDFHFQYKT